MKKTISPAAAVIIILVVVVVVAAIGYSVFSKKPSASEEGGEMVDFSEGSGDMKQDPVQGREDAPMPVN